MTRIRTETAPERMPHGRMRPAVPADTDGSLYTKSVIRSQQPVVFGADIPGGPCDALLFSADTDAVIVAADDDPSDPANQVTTYYTGRIWHPIAARRVLSVTGGVSCVAGWQRKRPPVTP